MFRVYTIRAPNILNEVFPLNPESSYDLRNQQTIVTRPINAVHYGSNLWNHLGPKIWEMVPSHAKSLETIKVATRKQPL